MEIYKLPQCERVDSLPQGAALALGNFDGVHRGHRRLFDAAIEAARCGEATVSAAWTFTFLAKPNNIATPCLTNKAAKLRLFAEYGLEYAVFEVFENVRNNSCSEFVELYLCNKLKISVAVCGFNFRFGCKGVGDAAALEMLMKKQGKAEITLQPVIRHGHIVSSSSVREKILEGDMDGAFDLLGHPFSICFPVLRGKQLGRSIGIPTINQNFPKGHIIPKGGIYACTVTVGDEIFLGVANVGTRPTVSSEGRINCETHIINYSGILYGKEIRVDFYNRIRDEKKFDGIDQLQEQIKQDVKATCDYFCALYGG